MRSVPSYSVGVSDPRVMACGPWSYTAAGFEENELWSLKGYMSQSTSPNGVLYLLGNKVFLPWCEKWLCINAVQSSHTVWILFHIYHLNLYIINILPPRYPTSSLLSLRCSSLWVVREMCRGEHGSVRNAVQRSGCRFTAAVLNHL